MEEEAQSIKRRTCDEAVAREPETLAVACPFCTVMLGTTRSETGAELRVADVTDDALPRSSSADYYVAHAVLVFPYCVLFYIGSSLD